MSNKPGKANFFPDVPVYPEMGTFQPVYGKFDLTTYIQGASDYEIMAFLVGKYNACLEAYGNITKLSTDTITACKQLQDWINSWFDNLDVQEELNKKIDSMVQDGSFQLLLHQTFDAQINQQTTNAVTQWLVTNVTPTGSAVVVDKTLSIEGAAADAKETGKAINQTYHGITLTATEGTINFNIDAEKTYHIINNGPFAVTLTLKPSNIQLGTFATGAISDITPTASANVIQYYATGETTFTLYENGSALANLIAEKANSENTKQMFYGASFNNNGYHKFNIVNGHRYLIHNNDRSATITLFTSAIKSVATTVDPNFSIAPRRYYVFTATGDANYLSTYSNVENSVIEIADLETEYGKLIENNGLHVTVEVGSSGTFSRLTEALAFALTLKNTVIHLGYGYWDVINELGEEYMNHVSSKQQGPVIGNGCKLICNDRATIAANYTGTNDTIREFFSALNTGAGGCSIINARIVTSNIRYSIHDDRGEDTDAYINEFIGCRISHNNGFYDRCIGGGFGINGVVNIKDCRFTGKEGGAVVSYHNTADGAWNDTASQSAMSYLTFTGNYSNTGTFYVVQFGKSTAHSTALVTNNYLKGAPYSTNGSKYYQDNIDLIAFNNTII